ncbi:hypothetical protein LINGRAHAP2_LOCUS2835, partial [Linum grandiflorum]
DYQHPIFVLQFQELCHRDREVQISYIYCETNNVADYLTNLGYFFDFGSHLLDSPDRDLSHQFHYNLIGVLLSRFMYVPHTISVFSKSWLFDAHAALLVSL